jgi:RNA polymerase sigma factor (sigma-70 family)
MRASLSCEVEMTDEELLDRFVSRRDSAAFEVLVRRHGPMVLGVCRRVLQHAQDAEDAFQATFLVLVRKAASLSQRELLGNWLYGVAYRTALDAREAAVRRQKRERQVTFMPETESRDESGEWRDLRPILDRELNRLPDKYRIPIVLCDLGGKTLREAAQQLDIPVGTLSGRLRTARERLAKRLSRYGLVLSSSALLAVLTTSPGPAAVPLPLVTSTVQAATAGAVAAPVAALAEGVVKALLLKKLLIAATVLLTLGSGAVALVLQVNREAARSGAARVLDLGFGERGRRVVWSPDGKTLVVVTTVEKTILGIELPYRGSAVQLWDVESGQMRKTLDELPGYKGLAFQQVVFCADGKTIASTVDENHPVTLPNGGMSMQGGWVVKIWDAKTLALKHTLPSEAQLFALALSPDGKLVAAGSLNLMPPRYTTMKKWIKLWNAQTGQLVRTLEFGEAGPGPISFAFSRDSKTFVIGCQKDGSAGQVQLWDTQSWQMKRAVDQEECVASVLFSANGKLLATASYKDSIQLWDAQKGEPIRSLKGVNRWRGVGLSPDGRAIATGAKDGTVRLWNTQTGELMETLKGHDSEVYSVDFSPDGKTLASTSQDETVRLWSLHTRIAGQK